MTRLDAMAQERWGVSFKEAQLHANIMWNCAQIQSLEVEILHAESERRDPSYERRMIKEYKEYLAATRQELEELTNVTR